MATIVTGAAGFVGFHVARALLARGDAVVGVDSLNAYYDVRLKQARLNLLLTTPGFSFHQVDLSDRDATFAVFDRHPQTSRVVHLAAQAGVRHSMVDPYAYVSSNVMGHVTVLEAARRLDRLEHLVYASSSSVYGGNTRLPFAEADRVGARSVAFPAISTGIYGYPREDAAEVAVRTLRDTSTAVQRVLMVAFDAPTLAAYERLL